MNTTLPRIIQGGMGAGVSHWGLACAVSRLGQLGVVSGTALEQLLTRRLQDGDSGGHVRRALSSFPFPRMAERIVREHFIPGGRKPGARYRLIAQHVIEGPRALQELCIAANFVEIFLAREGHSHPVGINYLEKIQIPHLASLYGAMLAGVAVVIMGAGIPFEIPRVLDALAVHRPVRYPVRVSGAQAGDDYRTALDPAAFLEGSDFAAPLRRPDFLPIIASDTLATMLCRRATGTINGFVIEGPTAGGHNAPPRGQLVLTADGQPIYGPRDTVDLAVMRKLGLPFWLAGSYGSPERLREAIAEGAAGVQVGTAFALCVDSALRSDLRQALIRKALSGQARVFTDPVASPTGFPFKVAELEGTLSDLEVYRQRQRMCDLGFLREVYRQPDGTLGYRCPAEPVDAFVVKGGKTADTAGRKCLCNALTANIGIQQARTNGECERPLVTLGDDFANISRFCTADCADYTAADVIRVLLQTT